MTNFCLGLKEIKLKEKERPHIRRVQLTSHIGVGIFSVTRSTTLWLCSPNFQLHDEERRHDYWQQQKAVIIESNFRLDNSNVSKDDPLSSKINKYKHRKGNGDHSL